jgi:short-subunit dehydrogenase
LQIKLRRQYNGFAALSVEKRQKGLNINLLAAVRLDQGLPPGMPKQDLGAIIHISSIQDKSINVNQQALVKVLNTTRKIGVTNGDLF